MLSETAVLELLREQIDRDHRAVGLAVGIVSPERRLVVAHGAQRFGEVSRVSGETLFEIGSATKLFTALLLSEAVQRGQLALSDPIAKYLPAGGRSTTLLDLATHTAGLPMFPPGAPPLGDPAWAGYSAEALLASLSHCDPSRTVGKQWEYSNMGYALLGLALAAQAHTDFPDLAHRRVFRPLGMTSTTFAPESGDRERQAQPHSPDLKPAPLLVIPGLESAGGAWSTANDMLNFLAAAAGLTRTPLASAFEGMLESPRVHNTLGGEQALGWWVWGEGANQRLNHDGGTVGSTSSIFLDLPRRTGVVVLCNTMAFGQNGLMANELARTLLGRTSP